MLTCSRPEIDNLVVDDRHKATRQDHHLCDTSDTSLLDMTVPLNRLLISFNPPAELVSAA
jgi:hypothetical protein